MPDKNRKEVIRTVRSDIQPAEFGRTNVHEHLLMRSPLLRGEELDDLERSAAEASEMHNAGIDALVELTPIGLGGDPRGLSKSPNSAGSRSSSPPVFISKRTIRRSTGFIELVQISWLDYSSATSMKVAMAQIMADPANSQLPFAPASSRSVPGTGGLRRWNVACLGQRARRTGKLAHQSSVTWKWAAQPGKCWIF